MKRTLAAFVIASAVIPFIASAGHRDLRDPNDARGRLDLRAVRVSDGRPPRWAIYTWNRWSAAASFDRGFVVVRFDTFGDRRFDYFALVSSNGRRLIGTLHRDYRRRNDRRIARLKVRRPGPKGVKLWVTLGKMRFSESELRYRWAVESAWSSRRCPNVCLDRAPDKGAVSEPAAEPRPTISPVPTISPKGPNATPGR